MRAFACISVVVFHIIVTSFSYSKNVHFFKYIEGWGAFGVDIFFVISGFVMLNSQMRERRSSYIFLEGRIIRILPIYWLITFVVSSLYMAFPNLFRELMISSRWLVSSLFFMSTWTSGHHPIVYVGWTLEWEMFFYIVFSLGLLFREINRLIIFSFSSILIFSLYTNHWIGMEFLFGMIAAVIYKRTYLPHLFGLLFFLVGGFVSFEFIPQQLDLLNLDRVLTWGVSAFMIVLGALYFRKINNKILISIGNASYSIYLIQVLSIPAFYKFSTKFMGFLNGDEMSVFCLLFTIVFGVFFYRIVEIPITTTLKNFFLNRGNKCPV